MMRKSKLLLTLMSCLGIISLAGCGTPKCETIEYGETREVISITDSVYGNDIIYMEIKSSRTVILESESGKRISVESDTSVMGDTYKSVLCSPSRIDYDIVEYKPGLIVRLVRQ